MRLVRGVFGAAAGDLGDGYQLHAEFGSFPPQCKQLSFGPLACKVSSTTVYIRLALGEQPIDQACQVARHGLDGFLPSAPQN